jgi:hypothetical protein
MVVDMQAVRAHVARGRILVDEPTDLPDGTELCLVPVDDSGELSDDERAELVQSIEDGAEDIARGEYVDGLEFANQLLARRATEAR